MLCFPVFSFCLFKRSCLIIYIKYRIFNKLYFLIMIETFLIHPVMRRLDAVIVAAHESTESSHTLSIHSVVFSIVDKSVNCAIQDGDIKE